MEFDFLTPISNELVLFAKSLSDQQMGQKIQLHQKKINPNWSELNVAIIGVLDKNNQNENKTVPNLSYFRKSFYQLYPGNWNTKIIDLGDIQQGQTKNDTYFAVKTINEFLLKNNTIPIIIGGEQDLTYPLYRSFDNLDQMVNVVAVDSKFDFGNAELPITANSYLSKMIIEEPNNLFNFSNLGYQTYFNAQEEKDLIEKLHFDAYRLGEVSNNISIAEPVFRDAHLISVDLTSVKSSDSGNFITFTPNGFDGKEICTLARYAGISDNVMIFGLFNQNYTKNEAVTISQIVWYFIEGYSFRANEVINPEMTNFIKYNVPIENEPFVFYKSIKTERWWMEIPNFSVSYNKTQKKTLLPCSHNDYLMVCNQEIPERWWKAQRKSII